jgi:sRNA-binding protein
MLQTLTDRFSNCFRPLGQPRLPLKIGIDKDVRAAAPDLDADDVSSAIRFYVRSTSYHQGSLVEGTARIDLDGNPCGAVDATQAKGSAALLLRRKVPA